MRLRSAQLALLLVVISHAVVARAEPTLKQSGDAAFDAQLYDDAAREYELAWAEKHDPAILYNLARTYNELGRYVDALDRLQHFADAAPFEVRRRVPRLDALLGEYRGRVATIEVHANVEGARVSARKVVVGETAEQPTRIKLNPGVALFEIAKEGYRPWSRSIRLEGGVVVVLNATLEPTTRTSGTYGGIDAPPRPVETRWYGYQTLAVDAVAIAVVAVGLGSEAPTVPLTIGAAVYALGPPTVHFAHLRPLYGGADLGLRLAGPLAGALLGYAADSHSDALIGVLVGGTTGAVAAIAVDAIFLAREPVEIKQARTIVPLVTPTKTGLAVGLGGTF